LDLWQELWEELWVAVVELVVVVEREQAAVLFAAGSAEVVVIELVDCTAVAVRLNFLALGVLQVELGVVALLLVEEIAPIAIDLDVLAVEEIAEVVEVVEFVVEQVEDFRNFENFAVA